MISDDDPLDTDLLNDVFRSCNPDSSVQEDVKHAIIDCAKEAHESHPALRDFRNMRHGILILGKSGSGKTSIIDPCQSLIAGQMPTQAGQKMLGTLDGKKWNV